MALTVRGDVDRSECDRLGSATGGHPLSVHARESHWRAPAFAHSGERAPLPHSQVIALLMATGRWRTAPDGRERTQPVTRMSGRG